MAYDEKLAERIRGVLGQRPSVVEKKMFGGIAFMVRDHMACGIVGNDLMVRIGAVEHEIALKQPHVRPMDFAGRPMKGMIYVGPAGLRSGPALKAWLDKADAFARSLPDKNAPKGDRLGSKKPRSRKMR